MMFQLKYKYGTEMANTLNYDKVNAYYFVIVQGGKERWKQ